MYLIKSTENHLKKKIKVLTPLWVNACIDEIIKNKKKFNKNKI
jgi:hypothetical protein